MTEAPTSLHVDADLTVSVGSAEAEVRSTGERLFVEFHSLSDARAMAEARPGSVVDRLPAALRAADLTVETRVRGRTVLVSGREASPGALSEILGSAPDEVRLAGVAGAAAGAVEPYVHAVYKRLTDDS
ncbi:uncharacterized protein Nmlp_2462 [Natronomonas moolapensis 8.8.11]|uniref:Uncharacterized protein n=1 Tax=Natronomonas moolapensis (strain DSM 18674 / CECT 7526 / JCM 14361 / 8.8.11) TaxID=268739 RepID=M1XKW5_NATM8|nr:hypothetical protein [Natronomonas moolapensis]CCQ36629.1 uncharacterized protein Nmlp_2462 [Natronomonas moolapensis 8.8.11]